MKSIDANIAGRTRSKFDMNARKDNLRKVLNTFLANFTIGHTNKTAIANVVIDQETGQIMEYRHLITHKNPKIRATWNKSAANELWRLFQGVETDDDGNQRVKGTDTFFFTSRSKVPNRKVKDVSHARIACTIR